jgi:hypothetical protein
MYRSRKTRASPNAASASADASCSAAGKSANRSTRFMPRPPPPLAALTSSGVPTCRAAAMASSTVATVPPAATGTPALIASARARSLSATASICAAVGPMNTTPFASHSCASTGRSERNP